MKRIFILSMTLVLCACGTSLASTRNQSKILSLGVQTSMLQDRSRVAIVAEDGDIVTGRHRRFKVIETIR